MAEQQTIIDALIDHIDKAILKGSVTNEQVAAVLDYLNEAQKGALRKDIQDTAAELTTFEKGLISNTLTSAFFTSGRLGSGFKIWIDESGKTHAEFDNVLARDEFITSKLTIADITSIGGQILLTVANMNCEKVEELTDVYRCYFNTDNNKIPNRFTIGDQALCQTYNGSGQKYYWRLVTAIGTDYIDLSKTDCDGTGIPFTGDEIIQCGNRTDASRQNALMLSAYGDDSPSLKQYVGIKSYSFVNCEKTVISPSGNKFTGEFSVKAGDSSVRIPADRGAWSAGMVCNYYDRVSHNGALWLCIISEETTTTEEPSISSQAWQKQVSEGGTGYRIEKLATPGYDFYRENQVYNHTLSVRVFYNEEDITETLNIQRFKWSRISENTEGDPTWNQLHANSGYEINITNQDLAGDTFFTLQFYDVTSNQILTTKF